ncbi:MAG TPA: alanine racemase [Blastocatellia bacterium]|nr:alanine racemase [Blastocatellia bacterium]
MNLQTLKTPSLLLDINRVRQNAEKIGSRVKELGASLRPHIKTHKCIEVAQIQTEGHSGAVTVSTLEEGRVFAANGFTDILYAVPIERGKFDEAIDLSRKCEKLSLITDNPEVPAQLDEAARNAGVTLNVFLKVDCGYHRCGVEPHTTEALEIPQRIVVSSNLRFAGILTHAGHSYHCKNREELLALAQHERDVMVEMADRLKSLGMPVPTVSIGSTPTISTVDHLEGINEVRPGNYIFFDAFQATLGSCRPEDCALTVLSAVVHRDLSRNKVIVDAGAIALSKDRGAEHIDSQCGYGWVLDLEGNDLGLRVESMSQEHGIMVGSNGASVDKLKVGTRVRILANHSCLTAAQHSHYEVIDGDEVVDRWQIHRGW